VKKVQDVDSKIRTGLAWNGVATVGAQAASLVITVILTRLLSPQDFGLVAMIAVFTGFASVFTDMGFGAALVQKSDLTQHHKNAVFWICVAVGALLTLIFAAAAPYIASFYGVPALQPITLAISIIFFINAFATVKFAVLQRAMEFRPIAAAQLTATVLAGLIAIYLAFSGFGVWSLITLYVASAAVNVVVLWLITPWRPDFSLRWDAVQELSKFSRNLVGFSAFSYWARNGDNLLIGRFVGSAALGICARVHYLIAAGVASIECYYKCDVPRPFSNPKRYGTGERVVLDGNKCHFTCDVSFDAGTARCVSSLRLGPVRRQVGGDDPHPPGF
jgi:O-antigen/teichoic acid export membrane protein